MMSNSRLGLTGVLGCIFASVVCSGSAVAVLPQEGSTVTPPTEIEQEKKSKKIDVKRVRQCYNRYVAVPFPDLIDHEQLSDLQKAALLWGTSPWKGVPGIRLKPGDPVKRPWKKDDNRFVIGLFEPGLVTRYSVGDAEVAEIFTLLDQIEEERTRGRILNLIVSRYDGLDSSVLTRVIRDSEQLEDDGYRVNTLDIIAIYPGRPFVTEEHKLAISNALARQAHSSGKRTSIVLIHAWMIGYYLSIDTVLMAYERADEKQQKQFRFRLGWLEFGREISADEDLHALMEQAKRNIGFGSMVGYDKRPENLRSKIKDDAAAAGSDKDTAAE